MVDTDSIHKPPNFYLRPRSRVIDLKMNAIVMEICTLALGNTAACQRFFFRIKNARIQAKKYSKVSTKNLVYIEN